MAHSVDSLIQFRMGLASEASLRDAQVHGKLGSTHAKLTWKYKLPNVQEVQTPNLEVHTPNSQRSTY